MWCLAVKSGNALECLALAYKSAFWSVTAGHYVQGGKANFAGSVFLS